MFDLTKALINNINQVKFLRNADRVTLQKSSVDKEKETNYYGVKNGSLDKINRLQFDVRISNLKVFAENYGALRWKRFWFMSLPAILCGLSITSFFFPSRVNKKDTAHVYQESRTTYNSDYGETESEKDVYVLGEYGEFFHHELVDPDGEVIDSDDVKDKIKFEIYNDKKYLTATINKDSDGILSVASADTGEYYDFDSKNLEYHETDEDYEVLYNKIISMLDNYNLLSDERKALNALSATDKKTIIIDIITYGDKGEADVILSKTRVPRRVVLIVILAIDLLINYFVWDANQMRFFEYNDLDQKNGELYEGQSYDPANFIFLPIRQKEAFIAAERERIMRLYDEINKNVVEEDRKRLLTGYEKKLIKKELKKRDRIDNAPDASNI